MTRDDNKVFLTKFGDKIRRERNKIKLSQEELAFRANIPRTYVGMIERVEQNITLITARKLIIALGLDISDFLKDL